MTREMFEAILLGVIGYCPMDYDKAERYSYRDRSEVREAFARRYYRLDLYEKGWRPAP